MTGDKLLYLVPLITYGFGALVFSVLSLSYWRERRQQRQSRGGRIFALFTGACLAAFVTNLLLAIAQSQAPDSRWETALLAALDLVAGLLPPLVVHVIYAEELSYLRGRFVWRRSLVLLYVVSTGAALARALDDSELVRTDWSDQLDFVPAMMLGAAGSLGLLVQISSRRSLKPVERRQRVWTAILLCGMLLCACGTFVQPAPWLTLLPDYLVLGFFCATLYYKERLVFFDLLIKRGAFFSVGVVGVTLILVVTRRQEVLLLLPFWMIAPGIYARLERLIDRAWLRRRYSPEDAERQFVRDVQPSTTEADLRRRAAGSLSEIFQAQAKVHFTPAAERPSDGEHGMLAELDHNGAHLGWIVVEHRPSSIAFMSDDRRLLLFLARTLGVVLENVRLREQQQQREQREHQLRLLTSRAELKALRAQINPHFLFNALNSIAGLISSQPELADETVAELAAVFRYTLSKSDSEWVSVGEEIGFVAAYLRVEQARFGERLQVKVEVDPDAQAIPIPAMTIQPLIENAIKHGVSASERNGTVELRVELRDGLLQVEVFDNGPGFPTGFVLESARGHAVGGHGLRNISERLAGYYGSSARLSWERAEDGTRVALSVPLGTNDPGIDRRR